MWYGLRTFDAQGIKILKIFFRFLLFYFVFEADKKLIYKCKIMFLDEFGKTIYILIINNSILTFGIVSSIKCINLTKSPDDANDLKFAR